LAQKKHIHAREISFTLWFGVIAILAVAIPTFVSHVRSIKEGVPCAGNWQINTWFAAGVPCSLTFQMCNASIDLDALVIWEVAAMVQTLVFGISVFWEMKREHFRRRTVLIVIAIISLPVWALVSMAFHWWHTQLFTTGMFVAAIFWEDYSLWVIERGIVAERSKVLGATVPIHELEFFEKVTWGLDLPLVIATIVLATVVWGPYDQRKSDYELARHFFAGAMAFSLIVANTGLVAYRILMHRQHFCETWRAANSPSVWEFLGLTRS
jgi:hypothetical protein